MGTEVIITIHSHDSRLKGEYLFTAMDDAFREIERIEELTKYNEMRSLNGYAGFQPAFIGNELISLIDHAYIIANATSGAFRPDLGPLISLWEIGTERERIPEVWEIDDALNVIEETYFSVLDSGMAELYPKDAHLDLGAIAKGYAVDRACKVLQESGVTAGMVWAGGDLKVFGTKPDHSQWRIAVRHPRNPEEFLTTLLIDSGAVATSGDYERYFEVDGNRYHHIFNPEQGYPALASIATTVFMKDCMDADAYATAFFVLGPEKGISVANDLAIPAIIVDEKGSKLNVTQNDRFARLVEEDSPLENK